MVVNLKKCLLKQFEISWKLLEYHLNGLTIEECLWKPTERGIHLIKTDNGNWKGVFPEDESYKTGPPNIAWLTWHIDFWWSMVNDYSFGKGELESEQILWNPSIIGITNRFNDLRSIWMHRVSNLSSEEMNSKLYSKWPISNCPYFEIVAWVNLELMKNASEIGYIRFLYANRI